MDDIYTVYITEDEREIIISALYEWAQKEVIRAKGIKATFPVRESVAKMVAARIERAKHADRLRTRFHALVDRGYTANEQEGE